MAKKKRSGKKAATPAKTGKRRGGRKPGTWSLLTPDTLRAWREENKLSRARLATMLGVSSTSVQNWESGHSVATTKTQQRLVELTGAPVERPAKAGRASALARTNGTKPAIAAASSNGDGQVIQVTGAIVVEVVRSGGKRNFSAADIGTLVRTVREALS